MYVYTVEQMLNLEKAADQAGHSYQAMMEQAGRALADAIVSHLGEVTEAWKRVVVLVGPGNNGGDGLVAARELSRRGYSVVAYLWRRKEGDLLTSDARRHGVALLRATSGHDPRLMQALSQAGVIIDALFGTGLSRPITGQAAEILRVLRQVRTSQASTLHWLQGPNPASKNISSLLVAVDVPSGINGVTGEIDQATVGADLTVTFAGPKAGMMTAQAATLLGQLVVAEIGIPAAIVERMPAQARLLSPTLATELLPARPSDGHKGTFGTTLVVGGSINYVGAPGLSAIAAGRSGAGLVTLGVPTAIQPILAANPQLTTATWHLLPHDMGVLREEAVPILSKQLEKVDALVLGPGLGSEKTTQRFVWSLFGLEERKTRGRIVGFAPLGQPQLPEPSDTTLPPMVVDADGLNALAAWDGTWWEQINTPLVLTPHPGEMGRLLKKESREIQASRLENARHAATRFKQVVVLKGAYTIIAAPDGRISLSPYANDALAKAGSGDVLAGIIGALLGQGMDSYEAACLGVIAHGLAGELIRECYGAQGALASDLLEVLPEVWKMLGI